MAGRPTKYGPDTAKMIADAIAAGVPKRHAAIRAGITEDTLAAWCKRYSDFSAAIKKAEADAVARNVALIQQAASSGTWQAAAWWLERRHPDDFARTEKQVLTGKDGGPIAIRAGMLAPEADLSRLTAEALAQLGHLLEAAKPEPREG